MNIEDLPIELLAKILSHLDLEELLSAENVSATWKEAASDPLVWQNLFVSCTPTNLKYFHVCLMGERSHLLRHLGHLRLCGCERSDEARVEALVSECPRLRTLEMIMCCVGRGIAKAIGELAQLGRLSLKNCYRITRGSHGLSQDDWHVDFSRLRRLRRLHLSDFGLADCNFERLLQCERLSHVDIAKIRLHSMALVERLASNNARILEALHVYGGDACTDDFVRAVSQCAKLRSLHIVWCQRLSDATLARLKNMKLNSLLLWNNSQFTEAGLRDLFADAAFSERLNYISFSKTENLTMVVVDAIAEKCTGLEFMGIYRCPRLEFSEANERSLEKLFKNNKLYYA